MQRSVPVLCGKSRLLFWTFREIHVKPVDRPMNLEKKHIFSPPFLVQLLRFDQALQFENPLRGPGRAATFENTFDRDAVLQGLEVILGLHWG